MADTPTIITASDVGAEIAKTQDVINGLDTVFTTECPKLTAATLAQWTAFKTQWTAFTTAVQSATVQVPGTSFGVYAGWPFQAWDEVVGFEQQVAAWQQLADTTCGAQEPIIQPPNPETYPLLTAVKWGGIVLISAAVLFALAPVFEVIAESAIAKRSAGSVKRLYRKARS
jgi:hypothetical protein